MLKILNWEYNKMEEIGMVTPIKEETYLYHMANDTDSWYHKMVQY